MKHTSPGRYARCDKRDTAEKYQKVTKEDRRQVEENTRKREVCSPKAALLFPVFGGEGGLKLGVYIPEGSHPKASNKRNNESLAVTRFFVKEVHLPRPAPPLANSSS